MNEIYVALIAGGVSLIGSFITFLIFKGNSKIKQREFELKIKNIEIEIDNLKQEQLTEIIKKRIEIYPILWEIFTNYGINWYLKGNNYDKEWITNFTLEIVEYNKKYGCFFSENVYKQFYSLRADLVSKKKQIESGKKISEDERLDLHKQLAFLAIEIKNDLGSYSKASIEENLDY